MSPRRFAILSFIVVCVVLGCIVAIVLARESPHKRSILQTAVPNPLQFSSNSTFKIALFADLHYGENAWTDWGPLQDVNSDGVISTVLDLELPDFVVYLGDLVTANNLPIANASLYWDKAINPTKTRGIPWSSLFGNHDDMAFEWPIDWFNASGIPQLRCPSPSTCPGVSSCSFRGTQRVELMNNETKLNGSFSKNGPQDLWPGVSNYVLQVSSSNDSKSTVAFLYFLDSGGGSYPEVISNAQVKWFQSTSQQLNPKSSVPEIIFWHIPSLAYNEVGPAPKSAIKSPCVGSINLEAVTPQQAENGMMDFISNRTSVKAVFVGHNHGLDWCCPYSKLWLCFARHSGYGGYGNWPRGARILEMTEQPFSLKSWIRMEDGTTHSEVVLS